MEPFHLRLWYLAADLEARRGDPEAAAGYLRAIATVDPSFLDVTERLGGLDATEDQPASSASKRLRQ